MKKIFSISSYLILMLFFMQSCEESLELPELSYVTFDNATYTVGVNPGSTETVDITVYTSNKVGSDRTIDIQIDLNGTNADPGSYTLPTSVTIPSGTNEGTFSVVLSDTNLGIGVNTLKANLDSSDLISGPALTIEYTQVCTNVSGTLDLVFDRWGSEVSWDIKDSLGGIVASGGGYADTAPGTTNSDSIAVTLCAGRSYTLTVYDSYGDAWGAGSSYTLTLGGSVVATGSGAFGSAPAGTPISSVIPFST